MSTTNRRLVTPAQFGQAVGVTERTVRRYIGEGYFTAYQMPGVRGVLVDENEAKAAMRRIPGRRAKAGTGSYGPRAKIVRLAARPIIVDKGDQ